MRASLLALALGALVLLGIPLAAVSGAASPANAVDDPKTASISGEARLAGLDADLNDARVQVELYLDLFSGPEFVASTTSQNYRYSFEGLAAGPYLMRFAPVDSSTGYPAQWWNGQTDPIMADVVQLAVGEARTVDGVLTIGSTITGEVRFANEASRSTVGEIDVWARDAGGQRVASSYVGSDSTFSVTGLEPGTYTLAFWPDGLNGYQNYAPPQTVTVGANETVGGYTVTLSSNQLSVSGTVTGLAGSGTASALADATVELYDAATLVQRTTTDAAGGYAFNGVDDGTYSLKVSADAALWVPQWFDGSDTQAEAELVSVAVPTAATADVELQAVEAATPTASPSPSAPAEPVPSESPVPGDPSEPQPTATAGPAPLPVPSPSSTPAAVAAAPSAEELVTTGFGVVFPATVSVLALLLGAGVLLSARLRRQH